MQRTQPTPERDYEFRNPASVGAPTDPERVEDYQRLVANPFLGFLGIVAWCFAFVVLLRFPSPLLVLALVCAWIIVGKRLMPFLFHFHCRDCGATGFLSDWRKHICPAIAERKSKGRAVHLRGPSPPLQIVLWFYLLLACAIAMNTLGWPAALLR